MSSKEIFCYAPWVHSHFTMTAKRALCCVAKPFDGKVQSLEEYWNSSEVRQARLSMLAGEPPSETCQICIENKNNSFLPTQMFDNYSNLADEFRNHTDELGYFFDPPRDYDFRMENLCNLSCRMCNPHASSKIEGLWRSVLNTDEPRIESMILKKNTLVSEIGPEFEGAIERGEVQRIYWASGEAFFQQSHWKLIEKIQVCGFAAQTTLKYNTNLFYPFKTLESFLEKLKGFKNVILFVSIDGVGETGQFIRDGLKWNTFQRALEEVERASFISIERFNVTVTIPGLLEIESLLRFLDSYSVELNVSLCDLGDQSSLLSPLALEPHLLKELVKRTEKALSRYRDRPLYKSFSIILENLKEHTLEEYKKRGQLVQSFYESVLIDRVGKRASLVEYYLSRDLTKDWLACLVRGHLDESHRTDHFDPYWKQLQHSMGQETDLCLTHGPEEFKKNLSIALVLAPAIGKNSILVSYIGSYPSVLSYFFLKGADEKKYRPFEFIIDHPLIIEQKITKIGFFSFMFRKISALRRISGLLDHLTLLALPSFFMHYHAIFRVTPEALESMSD